MPAPSAPGCPGDTRAPATVRVKLMGAYWTSSRELCEQWQRQSQGAGRWEELQATDDDDADYYAIINHPHRADDFFVAERAIVFQMEPATSVAGWGAWAAPDPRRFVQVRSHERFPNNVEWHLRLTYRELHALAIRKTKGLSAVVSGRRDLPGHHLRLDFLRYLEDSGAEIDVYGWENRMGLASYRGPLPIFEKDEGLLPYRYHFAAENCAEHNYFTEKLVDAVMSECLCFYWGAPNVADHVDPAAFVALPLDSFAESREIIQRSIAEDQWRRRLPAIRAAKRRLLDQQQFFPTLARAVRGHRLFEALAIRVIAGAERSGAWGAFRARVDRAAGRGVLARCQRVRASDALLGHVAAWRGLLRSGSPAALVLEESMHLCHGFVGQLVEACGQLCDRHRDFDIVLVGFALAADAGGRRRRGQGMPAQVGPVDWACLEAGPCAYLVSPAGARRLLEIVDSGPRRGRAGTLAEVLFGAQAQLNVCECVPHLVATAPMRHRRRSAQGPAAAPVI